MIDSILTLALVALACISLLLVESRQDMLTLLRGTLGKSPSALMMKLLDAGKSQRFLAFALYADVNAYDLLDRYDIDQRMFKLVLSSTRQGVDEVWLCQVCAHEPPPERLVLIY